MAVMIFGACLQAAPPPMPDPSAQPIPSGTPFPDYRLSDELRLFIREVVSNPTTFTTDQDRAEIAGLTYGTAEYDAKFKEIRERNQQASDEFIHATPQLVPALFWLLNDYYMTGDEYSIIQTLHSISHCFDLTTEQLQSIRQHVLKQLKEPKMGSNERSATAETRGDYAVLQGALQVLARHPGPDTEEILLRALDRPNDLAVNRFAADALAIIGSERGLDRVRALWESEPPDSGMRLVWKVHLDRLAAGVAAKQEKEAAVRILTGEAGDMTKKESTQIEPPRQSLAEVRSSALGWLWAVVGFALLATGWLGWSLRRK